MALVFLLLIERLHVFFSFRSPPYRFLSLFVLPTYFSALVNCICHIHTNKNTWLRRERRKLLFLRSYHILFFCFLRFLGRTPPRLFFFILKTLQTHSTTIGSYEREWRKGKTNCIVFVVRLQRKNKGEGGFFFFGVMVALVDLSLAIHCSTAFSPSHFPHLKAPFYL